MERVLLQERDVAPLCHRRSPAPMTTVRSDQQMKARQFFVASLLALAGALITWATASGLEQYAIDTHAASAFSTDGTAPYNPGEPRRRF